jgi:phosphate transport system protein
MSRYEERLSEDLGEIRTELRTVTEDINDALNMAIEALRKNDTDLLNEVVIGDLKINRKISHIDDICHQFVVRHLPAAGHLRFISSTLRMTIGLERAGDYAVTISRVVLQLEKKLDKSIVDDISKVAEASHNMLRDAMRAFLESDLELAQNTRLVSRRIAAAYDGLFHTLIEETPRRPRKEMAALVTIFAKLDRFSDQAKNVCDATVFSVTGEEKTQKRYRVIFIDKHNDLLSHLAECIAWKGFSNEGIFASAGWAPSKDLHPNTQPIVEKFGLELRRAQTTLLSGLNETPVEYNVVVFINPDEDLNWPEISYHTILQKWQVPTPLNSDDAGHDESVTLTVHQLTSRINDLMERLCGKRPS